MTARSKCSERSAFQRGIKTVTMRTETVEMNQVKANELMFECWLCIWLRNILFLTRFITSFVLLDMIFIQ